MKIQHYQSNSNTPDSNAETAAHVIPGFLLYCLHPFCLCLSSHQHPHSQAVSPLQTSTAEKLNKLLRPVQRGKTSTVKGKF